MASSYANVVVPLPRPLTPLVGRRQELNLVSDRLRSDARLITITGFGGMGKTRLALQVALELEPAFAGGALFVPLANVTEGSDIPATIARIAGLDESIDSVAALAEKLGHEELLLVLDNLEQISDAVSAVMALLTAMPSVTILVTSRHRLELSGEYVLPLDRISSPDAVQLFCNRAQEAGATSSLNENIVLEICEMLDGIPLAIELAAARMSILSAEELRTQLDAQLSVLASSRADLPERHRTMRKTIGWTFDLLGAAPQRIFLWLSVYEPDFSLESVRHISRQLDLGEEPLDIVQFLASRSLIRPVASGAGPRYQMQQMLREFGHEYLVERQEDSQARYSHALDMLALAESAEPHLTSFESRLWTSKLDSDLPNTMAAIEWCLANNQHAVVQRTIAAIWRFIVNKGLTVRVLGYLVSLDLGATDDRMRSRALVAIGYLHESTRELDPARDAFEKALPIARNLSDQAVLVRVLTGLGTVLFDQEHTGEARTCFNEALDIAERIDDGLGLVSIRGMIALVHQHEDETEEAISWLRSAQVLAEQSGNLTAAANCSMNLGFSLYRVGNYEEAETHYRKALTVYEEAGDIVGACYAYANLAGANQQLERTAEARSWAEKGLVVVREAGLKHVEIVIQEVLAEAAHREGSFALSAYITAQAARDFDYGDEWLMDYTSRFIDICLAFGMREDAARLLGSVQAMRQSLQVEATGKFAESERSAQKLLESDSTMTAAIQEGAKLEKADLVDLFQRIASRVAKTSRTDISKATAHSRVALTTRETEVLTMVARGFSNAEIADEMFVSTRTVTTHLTNIFGKLEVTNRSRAAAVAMEAGLL